MGAPPAMRTSCMCGMKRSEFRPEESERRASRSLCQSPPEQTADAVASALAHSYRLIDTAAAYSNERQKQSRVPGSRMAFDIIWCEMLARAGSDRQTMFFLRGNANRRVVATEDLALILLFLRA